MPLFGNKIKLEIHAYIFKSEDMYGKVSYSHDLELSRYIKNSNFIPRNGDVLSYNNSHFKVDKVIIDYSDNNLNILMSNSKVDVRIQK